MQLCRAWHRLFPLFQGPDLSVPPKAVRYSTCVNAPCPLELALPCDLAFLMACPSKAHVLNIWCPGGGGTLGGGVL